MLKSLYIENIAVIERASIDFEEGMTVLTGETGAGKSIIIDSINLVLGERTSRELIRTGAKSASVSALFEIGQHSKAAAMLEQEGISWQEGVLFERSVTVESDTFAVHLTEGVDSVYGVTKLEDAVGMTAPQSYGAAPYIEVPGTTWAPVDLFEMLGVTVTDADGVLTLQAAEA